MSNTIGIGRRKPSRIGKGCGMPGNGIGAYVFEKLNVGCNHTCQ